KRQYSAPIVPPSQPLEARAPPQPEPQPVPPVAPAAPAAPARPIAPTAQIPAAATTPSTQPRTWAQVARPSRPPRTPPTATNFAQGDPQHPAAWLLPLIKRTGRKFYTPETFKQILLYQQQMGKRPTPGMINEWKAFELTNRGAHKTKGNTTYPTSIFAPPS